MIIKSFGPKDDKTFIITCNHSDFLRLKEALEVILRSQDNPYLDYEQEYFNLMQEELRK